MAKSLSISTLLIFQSCLFCHNYATTIYMTPSPATTTGGVETTTAAVATPNTVSGVVGTTTAGGGDVSSTTASGEVRTTVESVGDVTTTSVATGGVTTSAVSVDGVTSTGGVGGGVTTTGDAAGQETATTVANSAVVGSEVTNTAVTRGDVTTTGGAVTDTASVGVVTNTVSIGAVTNTASVGAVTNTVSVGAVTGTASVGAVTSTASVGVVTNTVSVGAVTSIASTGVIATNTTGIGETISAVGGGETSSAVDGGEVTPTTTQTAPPLSSVYGDKRPGPEVLVTLTVNTDCSGSNLARLNESIINGFRNMFRNSGFQLKGVAAKSVTCDPQFKGTYSLSFYRVGSSGSTIEQVVKGGLGRGDFGDSVTESNTVDTFEFQGVEIEMKPKSGECDRVCCDGAGGELVVELTCSPADKCGGFDLSEKKATGYCPGEGKSSCDCNKGLQDLPSFALITVLGLASLMRSIFSS